MIKLYDTGVFLVNQSEIIAGDHNAMDELRRKTGREISAKDAKKGTIAYKIIEKHNVSGEDGRVSLKFDSIASHDITYVGIIQTARASGMDKFPIPYVLTNCHNSLCAVGGTINEDDHKFALSAAKKYGGIYVPANLAVIHSYMREKMAVCGGMILASDSHTRYGALGTLAVGEGGGELAKQILGKTYDIDSPDVIAVYLTGKPQNGVGPHDVALSIIAAVYKNGYVKNKVMEFVGDGVSNLPVEFRNGIDVMTTETTCWSSVWRTDSAVKDYYEIHNRKEAFLELNPESVAYYDGMVYVDLSDIKPSIAMPFHPSNVYTIEELNENAADIFAKVESDCLKQIDNKKLSMNLLSKIKNGGVYVDQGIVAGCAGGTFDNICDVSDIMDGRSTGNGCFSMSIYPGSQPAYNELIKNGSITKLMSAGAIIRSAFCGPCFGAGDTPASGELSIRHTTRNFPNREGSKPYEGQLASVALMDARSIAATAINGGRLTAATDLDISYRHPKYYFDSSIYEKRVYDGTGRADPSTELRFGPNIKDWPQIPALTEDILLRVVSYITDPVTTTDELIPSGETSSFRSDPIRLSEFTLSRKDPKYVGRAKEIQKLENSRRLGDALSEELMNVFMKIRTIPGCEKTDPAQVGIGSTIYAVKPGDGSAREQAASCQRILGGWANIAQDYATKRYRSNCINWGILPFKINSDPKFDINDYIFVPRIKEILSGESDTIIAYVIGERVCEFKMTLGKLTDAEKQIMIDGCLINYYKNQRNKKD